MQRSFNERVIDANRRDFDAELLDAKFLDQFLLDRLPRFRAQPPHALVGVVAGKRGQIHAGDRAQKPRRLPFFLYSPSRDLRLRAALDGAGVHSHFLHPIQIKRDPGVRQRARPLSVAIACPVLDAAASRQPDCAVIVGRRHAIHWTTVLTRSVARFAGYRSEDVPRERLTVAIVRQASRMLYQHEFLA